MIICAAIKIQFQRNQYQTVEAVVPGLRHSDCHDLLVTLSIPLRRQEEDGFITRTPSATDKRIMQLFPTQKTLDLLPQISRILIGLECCLTADLTEEEKTLLEDLLSRMLKKASDWMDNH